MSEYTDLITPEHAEKPKFFALVDMSTSAISSIRDLQLSYIDTYDLDSAEGAQLDVIGLWVGISRNVAVPISGVYFSFDTVGLGFDQGVWKGPFDPDTGITSLPDDTYRILIRAKIGANRWDGSMAGWKAIIDQVFPPETGIFAQDNGDMTMTVVIAGTPPSALFVALLTGGYLPLKPEAIGIAFYFVNSNPGTPAFGFDAENDLVSGFDVGSWVVPA